jgi:Lhr-like helicase
MAVVLVASCSNPREASERDAERAIAKTFGVNGDDAKVDVNSKTGVIKVEGADAKYVKGAQQGRPEWMPDGLPLPADLVIDVSREIRTTRLIRSVKGTTKTSLAELRNLYRSAATTAGYRIAAATADAAIPDREIVLLAYTQAGDPIDVRVSSTGDFDIFVGRLWEASTASTASTSATTAA